MVILAVIAALVKGGGWLPIGYYRAKEAAAMVSLDFTPEDKANVTPTVVPAPEGAVDVLADGVRVCTVVDKDTAVQVLSGLLSRYGQAPDGEQLIRVSFSREMTLAPAASGEQVLDAEQAFLALDRPDICPVEQLTRTVIDTPVEFAVDEAVKTKLLPKGSRLIVQAGREGLSRTVVEAVYINGVEKQRQEPLEEQVYPPLSRQVSLGSFKDGISDKEPGKSRGEPGPELDIELNKPCEKGSIVSNFGFREGRMHYGVDYDAKAGTEALAPAGGVVVYAGKRGSFHGVVDIDHGGGLVTRLARLTGIRVAPGETVEAGQPVGLVIEPEEDEEAVLHLETLVNLIAYNPRQYLK